MTLDLSGVFGESAAARLRGLLPRRAPGDEHVPETPAPDAAGSHPEHSEHREHGEHGEHGDVDDPTEAGTTGGFVYPPIVADTMNRRWGMTRVVSREHVDLLVLSALRDGPDHAHGIIERLRHESSGTLQAPERTVHRTLHRLTRNRLLVRVHPGPRGGPRYRLSEAGQRAVRARSRQWSAFARAVDAVVGTPTST